MTFPEERAAIIKILQKSKDPVCLVNLGAQDGGDVAWMCAFLPNRNPRFVLVEADKVNFDLLSSQGFSGPDVVYGAIAAYNGTCDFWENRDCGGGFGSIYEPNREHLSVDQEQWRKTGPIPCFTFDALCERLKIDHIDLLFVDIHGAEKDMIRFGQNALRRTRYLFVEAVDYRMYANAATRDELVAMLPGWNLLQIFPWNVLLENPAFQ